MKFQAYIGVSPSEYKWKSFPFFQWLMLRKHHDSRIILWDKKVKLK
jgi:hypothetical protein